MPIKSISLDRYFELIKPVYKLVQVIPDKSIRNYKTDNIAIAISYMYKTLSKRVHKEQKKLFFETSFKISYIIDITKDSTSFYFMLPDAYLGNLLEKMREVWPKATIKVISGIRHISEKASTYEVGYKYEDALSLHVNRSDNEPLNSILNVLEIMQDDDRVVIVYNFIPHKLYNWTSQYNNTLEQMKYNKSIIRNKYSKEYMIKSLLSSINNIVISFIKVVGEFLGNNKESSLFDMLAITVERHNELSESTRKKKNAILLETQIAVISDSTDDVRKINNASSVCQSFYNSLDGDNQLIYDKTGKIDIYDRSLKGIQGNIMSVSECSSFIQLPGRELMNRLGIKHAETSEVKLPKQLQKGYINLGNIKYREDYKTAYIEDDYNIGALPLVIVGAQGSGKSTFIANYYRFASQRGEGGLIIDFIKNNELSNEVERYLPEDRVIKLDLSKESDIQGFAFNEIDMNNYKTTFDKLKMANLQAQQVINLVNAINPEQPLQARMSRYLGSAAQIVFSTGETSLKEVIRCLENHIIRDSYIEKIPESYRQYVQEEFDDMEALNEYSKPTKDKPLATVIGTKESKIEGVYWIEWLC